MLLDLLPLLQSAEAIAKTGGGAFGLEAGATVVIGNEVSVSASGSDFTRPRFYRITKAGGASLGLHGGGSSVASIDYDAVLRARIREADELLLVGAL